MNEKSFARMVISIWFVRQIYTGTLTFFFVSQITDPAAVGSPKGLT